MSGYSRSYNEYLGSKKCCDLRGEGPQGNQGKQGKPGPIGPIGNTGSTGPQGRVNISGTGLGYVVVYDPSNSNIINYSTNLKMNKNEK